jgi:hypothetical protein
MDFSERIGRRLKLQDLHVLMTVAQAGSMAAHVVLERRPRTAMQGLWPWIEQASKRLHREQRSMPRAP